MDNITATLAAVVLTVAIHSPLRAEETARTATAPTADPKTARPITALLDDLRSAFEDASGGLSISGFFDVNAHEAAPDEVSFGSFELGMAREVGSRAELVGAVVMNETGADLTVGLIDIRLSPVSNGDDGRDTLRLQAGRFDVRFGADWQQYASKDRVEISAPLTTTTLLDGGLNATGIQLVGGSGFVHYSGFVVRDGGETIGGGRIGVSTHGTSAGMSIMRRDGTSGSRMIGVDVDARAGRLHVRAERIERIAGDEAARLTGWHITADAVAVRRRHATLTPFVRYDAVDGTALGSAGAPDGETRLTAGLNTSLAGIVTFKLEYQLW